MTLPGLLILAALMNIPVVEMSSVKDLNADSPLPKRTIKRLRCLPRFLFSATPTPTKQPIKELKTAIGRGKSG
jgi:hypothetical protein